MTLQRPLIFGVFREKWHVFPKVLFLKSSTVFCMLVMFTHGGTAETVEIKSMCHIANLQLIVAGAILFWLLEGAGAKISKVLVLVYVFDAMVWISLASIFGRALLFHYCTHEGRSQHSVADMRVHCSILVSTCPWKICPYNANPQRPFFLQTYLFLLRAVRTASESTGKCVQSTEISVQFGPVRTKRTFFQETHLFFHVRPSIRQNCFSSWHHKIRASGCAQTPCMFRISVAMCKCLPPQLIIKSRQRFYISTRIVDPKLFSHPVLVMRLGLNDV